MGGKDFGVTPTATSFYLLRRSCEGQAVLYLGATIESPEVYLDHRGWAFIADRVAESFNSRLAAKGMPTGSWPEPGEEVRLHPQFGRELEMLMLVAGESYQGRERNVSRIEAMDSSGRAALWKKWEGYRAIMGSWDQERLSHLIIMLRDASMAPIIKKRREGEVLQAMLRYVQLGDIDALDIVFETSALTPDELHSIDVWVRSASDWGTPEERVERRLMIDTAMAAARDKRLLEAA